MDRNEIYTVSEVAQMLKVCKKTVYQIIRAGDLEAIRVRGQIRITSSALENYFVKGGENEE